MDAHTVTRSGGCRTGTPAPAPVPTTEGWDDEMMATGTGLQVLGVSFKTAALAVREPLVLDGAAVAVALASARRSLVEGEALILSTCNRTELYVVGAEQDAVAAWHEGVVAPSGADGACPALAAARYHLTGRAAARHLFRVASGLESALLGDNEIVGQLRGAARLADEAGTLGPRLRLVVDHALRTSKQARSRTSIGAGGAGVGSAVAALVAARRDGLQRVVLIGAGDAASIIARELRKRAEVELVVANRSPHRALPLAEQHGGIAVGLDALPEVLAHADVVVAATAASTPVVTGALVDAVRSVNPAWRPLVIDAGVPRNVAPGIDLEVATMETLAERTHRVARLRAAAVADVERCIHEGLARWHLTEMRRLVRHGIVQLDVRSPLSAAC